MAVFTIKYDHGQIYSQNNKSLKLLLLQDQCQVSPIKLVLWNQSCLKHTLFHDNPSLDLSTDKTKTEQRQLGL